MDNIRGKTIAITGAARGIGFATAKALLARGARVVIGDRDVAFQESAVADLTKLGPVSGYPLDVTDRESFATFLDKARTDGGGHIDVLINNAGVMPIGPFLEQSEQTIRSTIEVNFYGVLTGCQLVLPEMVARRSGHIVNIASLAGMLAVPGQVVYAGTKFAVVGLSSGLSDEFAPQGVEVSCVMPTFTNTELDHRHPHLCGAEAGRARGHRGGRGQGAGQADHAGFGSAVGPVHQCDHANAVCQGSPLDVAQDGQRHGVPQLRCEGAAELRAARAGRSGRRRVPGAVGLDRVDPLEELVGRHRLIVCGADQDHVHELGVLGHVHPDRRHRLDALTDLGA